MKLIKSNINLTSKPYNKILEKFGVNFDINEEFSYFSINETKLTIDYVIYLYNDKKQFGIINATYDTLVPEAFEFISLNEQTKQQVLLYYLKSNHNNIFKLIEKLLLEQELSIKQRKTKELCH